MYWNWRSPLPEEHNWFQTWSHDVPAQISSYVMVRATSVWVKKFTENDPSKMNNCDFGFMQKSRNCWWRWDREDEEGGTTKIKFFSKKPSRPRLWERSSFNHTSCVTPVTKMHLTSMQQKHRIQCRGDSYPCIRAGAFEYFRVKIFDWMGPVSTATAVIYVIECRWDLFEFRVYNI